MDINNLQILKNISAVNSKIDGISKRSDELGKTVGAEEESFKDVLGKFVGDVNQLQKQADTSVNKLASGEITDIHSVMVKVEEANLSFSLMMEIRNKIVEGYKEILRTGV